MLTYEKMNKQEAAAALHEFLDERPGALAHLTRYLAGHSEDTVRLDGDSGKPHPALALGEIGTDGADDGSRGG